MGEKKTREPLQGPTQTARWSSSRHYACGEPGPVGVNAMLPPHGTKERHRGVESQVCEWSWKRFVPDKLRFSGAPDYLGRPPLSVPRKAACRCG